MGENIKVNSAKTFTSFLFLDIFHVGSNVHILLSKWRKNMILLTEVEGEREQTQCLGWG